MSDSRNKDREEIRHLVREALEQQIAGQSTGGGGDSPETIDESAKTVITEADLHGAPEGARLLIRGEAIITPSASDLIRERRIEIRYRTARAAAGKQRLIAVGSDHGGYEMKEQLKKYLDELGYRYRDCGTYSSEAVDYPDYAHTVARTVSDGACQLGIIIDGAGIGSCMTANKVPGVRAAMCYDEATARNSREHNYANVLTLGGRMISLDAMRLVVRTWLSTPEGEERHGKRVAKIMAIEKQYLR